MKIRRGDIVFVEHENEIQKGNIQNLNRPFLVVSNNIGNEHSNIFLRNTYNVKR